MPVSHCSNAFGKWVREWVSFWYIFSLFLYPAHTLYLCLCYFMIWHNNGLAMICFSLRYLCRKKNDGKKAPKIRHNPKPIFIYLIHIKCYSQLATSTLQSTSLVTNGIRQLFAYYVLFKCNYDCISRFNISYEIVAMNKWKREKNEVAFTCSDNINDDDDGI